MSLQDRLASFITAVGADIKAINIALANRARLDTANTFAGKGTFTGGLYDGLNQVYSDSNPPQSLDRSDIAAAGADTLPAIPDGATPAVTPNTLVEFIRKHGGRRMNSQRTTDGSVYTYQPHSGLCMVGFARWAPGVAAPQVQAPMALLQTTAPTAVTPTAFTAFGSQPRGRFTTGTTLNAQNGPRDGARLIRPTNVLGAGGGFHAIARFGVATSTATSRLFCGVYAGSGAPFSADPSTVFNLFGVGWDSADANMMTFTNDGAGAATKTSLGANFPNRTAGVDLYEVEIFCSPALAAPPMSLTVRRLNTGHYFEYQATTDLPVLDTMLSFQIAIGVGTALTTAAVDVCQMHVETP